MKVKANSRLRRTPDYYYYRGSRATAPVMLATTILLGIFSMGFGQVKTMITTWHEVSEVEAYTPPVVVVQPKDADLTQKQQIQMYIIEVFGDKSMEALKIAECESRFNPETVGDTHLMSINNQTGELIGDSIGIFQVRVGDTTWNRAAANGLTVDEFRAKLKDYRYNVDYAKTIYDRAGSWKPWYNCSVKVLN
jgi:hypothetical protein